MKNDSPQETRPELLDDFYAEADELLGNVRTNLTLLEAAMASATADYAALDGLFRSIHSLKGISGMVAFRPAEELAHAAEGFLRQLTRRTSSLTRHGLELLFATSQRLEQMVGAHRLRQPVPDAGDLLREFLPFDTSAAVHTSAAVAAPELSRPDSTAEVASRIEALRASGLAPWQCTFLPSRHLDERGVNITSARARLSAIGEIVSATPSVRPDGSVAFDFLLGMRETPPRPADWEQDGLFLRPLEDGVYAPAGSTVEPNAPGSAASQGGLFIAPSHIVRVDLTRLDELMRITGEMVIHRSRLDDRINQISGDTAALREANQVLARSLRQLRTAITRVRLVPVAEIFTRMPFVVRDLEREAGRKVRLVLEGQHTEIDKYLVEQLKDPVLHLVRNAVSHGAEPAGERVAAGKPAEATILLRATAAGEFVVIEVQDDGRGIDAASIALRAAALGFDVPEPLDDAGMLHLLCSPGFSTREAADRMAGRGVGMAVVRDAVRKLGGRLTLETKPGRGTRFTLRLPLTLSITESLIVAAGGQTCAVPYGCIDEILQISETDVRTIKQAEVIPYRDGVLPLLRLRSLFHGTATPARPQVSVLVLSSERGSTGLVVDRVHTQREIVVRPMLDTLLQVPGIAGATDLGDGRPVLILDPIAITSGVVRPRAGSSGANHETSTLVCGKFSC